MPKLNSSPFVKYHFICCYVHNASALCNHGGPAKGRAEDSQANVPYCLSSVCWGGGGGGGGGNVVML